MQSVVLDNSVIMKWFASEKEEFMWKAKKMFIDCLTGKIRVYIPELLLHEIINVLLKSKKLSLSETENAMKNLHNLPLKIIPFSRQLESMTIKMAYKYKLTSYDATYAALAVTKNALLYTCDQELISTNERYIRHLGDYV